MSLAAAKRETDAQLEGLGIKVIPEGSPAAFAGTSVFFVGADGVGERVTVAGGSRQVTDFSYEFRLPRGSNQSAQMDDALASLDTIIMGLVDTDSLTLPEISTFSTDLDEVNVILSFTITGRVAYP